MEQAAMNEALEHDQARKQAEEASAPPVDAAKAQEDKSEFVTIDPNLLVKQLEQKLLFSAKSAAVVLVSAALNYTQHAAACKEYKDVTKWLDMIGKALDHAKAADLLGDRMIARGLDTKADKASVVSLMKA